MRTEGASCWNLEHERWSSGKVLSGMIYQQRVGSRLAIVRNQQDPSSGSPPPPWSTSAFSGCGTFLEGAQIAGRPYAPRSTDVLELLCRSANF
jgi:hypothetical protein